jgi:PQQ-like domain
VSPGRPPSLARVTTGHTRRGTGASPARRARVTRWRLAVLAGGTGLALIAAACSAGGGPSPRRAASPAAHSPAPSASPATGPPQALQITPAAYQLPWGISGEVVLARGGDLLIIGGLSQRSVTTAAVTQLNPVTGRTARVGRLAGASRDAAGALLGGQPFLFGGGVTSSISAVQSLRPGHTAAVAGQLPGPRSGLSSVTLGPAAYLVGGYDGASYDAAVLRTTNGTSFTTVAKLPVPVRYAAVAGTGNDIWVFGGQTPAGPTSSIQRVDITAGRAAVVGHLPAALSGATAFTLGGRIFVAGGRAAGSGRASRAVLAFDPASRTVTAEGMLPVGVSNAASAVVGGTALVVGGYDGHRPLPSITQVRLVPVTAGFSAVNPGTPVGPLASAADGIPGEPATDAYIDQVLTSAPWLGAAHGKGHLAPGSDPSVLPGDILIADDWNNRLLIVDPRGRVRWRFPRPGDLASGQSFLLPDDAFFSPDGKEIIATEEEDSVVSVISIARHQIVYRYGTPGVPGGADNYLSNPDDAMMLPGGGMLISDIKNCRILELAPPSRQLHRPRRIIGTPGACGHNPPHMFGSPNGAFPSTNGSYLVTEITGDWVTQMSLSGRVAWSTHPPGVAYPSDTNEVYPGRYLTADYSQPGQVVEFSASGRLLWRFGGLNHPSLALPLPNGDILVNDDYNHRVIVIDPLTRRIVWQYGHTGVPGTAPGYLNDPDGLDLVPPDSMLITHAPTMGLP